MPDDLGLKMAAHTAPSATEDLEAGAALSKQKKWPEARRRSTRRQEGPHAERGVVRDCAGLFGKDRCKATEAMIEPLMRCLDLDPNHANARGCTAVSSRGRDRDVVAAAEEFRVTIRLDPTNPTARWSLGYMLEHYLATSGRRGLSARRVDSSSPAA